MSIIGTVALLCSRAISSSRNAVAGLPWGVTVWRPSGSQAKTPCAATQPRSSRSPGFVLRARSKGSPREVGLQEVQPDALGGGALRARMAEGLARGRQAALDVAVKPGQDLGQGPGAHLTIWPQVDACMVTPAAAAIFSRSALFRSSE